MISLEKLIGMPLDEAVELLKEYKIKINDISAPDKYHSDVAASFRIIKAVQSDDIIELYIAGFKDSI